MSVKFHIKRGDLVEVTKGADAGKTGKVKIVCFDEEKDTLDGVKAGDIEGTIVQQPYEFGYQAIHKMAQAARKQARDAAMANSGDRSIANIGWLYMHDAAEMI